MRPEKSNQVPQYFVSNLRTKKFKFCLVIPVLNEGDRLLKQLQILKSMKYSVDVIIADGGSSDNSIDEVTLFELNVSTLLKKIGIGKLSSQLRMAFDFALSEGYEGVITIDGNGKDGVEALEKIIFKLESGFDFIQASRFIKGGESVNTPLVRFLAIRCLHSPITSLAARFRFTDSTNGFRGHSRKLLTDTRINLFRDIFDTYELIAYLPIRAARLGFKCVEIPARREYPNRGDIPTKIHGLRAHFQLIKILFYAAFGRYN